MEQLKYCITLFNLGVHIACSSKHFINLQQQAELPLGYLLTYLLSKLHAALEKGLSFPGMDRALFGI